MVQFYSKTPHMCIVVQSYTKDFSCAYYGNNYISFVYYGINFYQRLLTSVPWCNSLLKIYYMCTMVQLHTKDFTYVFYGTSLYQNLNYTFEIVKVSSTSPHFNGKSLNIRFDYHKNIKGFRLGFRFG